MKNLGQALMREGAPALQRAVWKTADLTKDSIEGADLVIASYVLGEMTDAERKIALQKLWNAAGDAAARGTRNAGRICAAKRDS